LSANGIQTIWEVWGGLIAKEEFSVCGNNFSKNSKGQTTIFIVAGCTLEYGKNLLKKNSLG